MKTGIARPALLIAAAMLAAGSGCAVQGTASAGPQSQGSTSTPIRHVIVIIGENHSFDNVFATYTPPRHQRIENLLSEGIVNADGTPGPSFAKAEQLTATDTGTYTLTPQVTGPYHALPQPNTTSVASGCDGLAANGPDTRFPAGLPDGPFQITRYVPYSDSHSQYGGGCGFPGAFAGDPLHRFYQMWQQSAASHDRLATWVANTAGDDNGATTPAPIAQGGVSMGFYNMAQGDAPYFQQLARQYAISDNYHQAVQGGTGANHIALGTGWAASYQNANGTPVAPPAGEIENPSPTPGTNNRYSQDGYGSASRPGNGGSYSECSNTRAPGVSAVDAYLATLPYKAWNGCQAGRYYILNNYNPGYNVDGTLDTATYTVPPQKTGYRTIGDALSAKNISWAYYGEGYVNGAVQPQYCGICDPMQYSSSIMTSPALRAHTQHGLGDFLTAAKNGTLPAVSFLKPGDDDGHPGYSTLTSFETFVRDAIQAVRSSQKQWRSTAIIITMDESGGYYDSGYIQPVSFLGDGPRVPLIVVSPWARHGAVDHTYNDHVSILKFIEANWHLTPLSRNGEDNLPDPAPEVYQPRNAPAIGDLMTMFAFRRCQGSACHAIRSAE